MGVSKARTLLVCYLFTSSFVFSMIASVVGQKAPISDNESEKIASELIADFEHELDDTAAKSQDDPDNDLDSDERPRVFFLLPFLPKLAIILVKIAIKAVPIIVKAAAAAVKAKAVAVAASVTKAAVVTVAKKAAIFIVKEVAIDAAFNYVTDKITEAVSPPAPTTTEASGIDPAKIHRYYETGSEECRCWKKKKCSCCVKPEGFETGCFNMTMMESLWNKKSKIKIGVFYAGKMIVTRRMQVHRPRQRCTMMPEPFHKTNLCISSYGRSQMRKEVTQCFSVYFNQRGISKCIIQDKKLRLRFEEEDQ